MRRIVLAFMLLARCPATFASPPTPDLNQLAHTVWKIADGFAEGAIYNVAQTPDGYLWIATDFGMLRFDGVRTKASSEDERLPSRSIRAVFAGHDGTLWMGTTNGLASWKDGKLTVYPRQRSVGTCRRHGVAGRV